MPIEIKELVIRVTATSEKHSEDSKPSPIEFQDETDTNRIVQECVQQVLRILKKSKER